MNNYFVLFLFLIIPASANSASYGTFSSTGPGDLYRNRTKIMITTNYTTHYEQADPFIMDKTSSRIDYYDYWKVTTVSKDQKITLTVEYPLRDGTWECVAQKKVAIPRQGEQQCFEYVRGHDGIRFLITGVLVCIHPDLILPYKRSTARPRIAYTDVPPTPRYQP